ncbi:MAG: 2,3,4,5-tetrahydropyridine-2,6-dicarboxylate N-succinyltransferase [Chloroflexota bacterium]
MTGTDTLLADLESGRARAAWPDPAAPGGWVVDTDLRSAIVSRFALRDVADSSAGGVFQFRDRAALPPRSDVPEGVRVVPGGTVIRAGAHLSPGVVVMPPAYVNIGAWIGPDAMVDSHVLVGSCAQIGARVHLAAGAQIGGVLEPPGARPVIVEDDAFVGGLAGLFDGVLVGSRAVIAAGVILTGTSRLYDLVANEVLDGTPDAPLAVPPGAVVVPAVRRARGVFAAEHGVTLAAAAIVKYRDDRSDARVAIEAALR